MTLLQKFFACHSAAAVRGEGGGGRGRVRAIDGEDKDARRQTILDAAERLFLEHHGLANVADVADAAGLAKGTVYLYFQTKEELYLALHTRHVERYFTALIAQLNCGRTFTFDALLELTDEHLISAPIYMPLGACCIGFAPDAVPLAAAQHFQSQMVTWLMAAGEGLERHFPKLAALGAGEGARLLKHSYAIMIGLHSLHGEVHQSDPKCPRVPGMGTYQEEATLALMRYWAHVAGTPDLSMQYITHSTKKHTPFKEPKA